MVQWLTRRLARQANCRHEIGSLHEGYDLVVAHATVRPFDPSVMLARSQRALHRADLPSLGIKDLRHGQAGIMFSESVHPQVVQEQRGHMSTTLTRDTYSHVTPGSQSEAVQQVGKVLDA